MFPKRWPLIVALFPLLLPAQERGDFQQILQRLDQLERENHNLAEGYMRFEPKSPAPGCPRPAYCPLSARLLRKPAPPRPGRR